MSESEIREIAAHGDTDEMRAALLTVAALTSTHTPTAQGLSDAQEILTEHSGCGHGVQVDQLTVRLHRGDKVVLVMGPYSAALAASRTTPTPGEAK